MFGGLEAWGDLTAKTPGGAGGLQAEGEAWKFGGLEAWGDLTAKTPGGAGGLRAEGEAWKFGGLEAWGDLTAKTPGGAGGLRAPPVALRASPADRSLPPSPPALSVVSVVFFVIVLPRRASCSFVPPFVRFVISSRRPSSPAPATPPPPILYLAVEGSPFRLTVSVVIVSPLVHPVPRGRWADLLNLCANASLHPRPHALLTPCA